MSTRQELDLARLIARKAHEGQVDKQGQPYAEHPLRVGEKVWLSRQGLVLAVAAILHDVLEDTTWTERDLLQAGVGQQSIDIVKILSRHEGETYSDFIDRIAKHRGAAVIKVFDILDNLDPDRGDGTFELPEKLRKRYLKALAVLVPVVLL